MIDGGAKSTRLSWNVVPLDLRQAIHAVIGSPVVEHRTQIGGFSTGVASRLRCANGLQVFVKAVDADVDSFAGALYERERRVAAALPRRFPAPAYIGEVRQDGWLALIFEDAGGPAVEVPWDPAELNAVLGGMTRLTEMGTPCPLPTLEEWGAEGGPWQGWACAAAEGTLEPGFLPARFRGRLDELIALEADFRIAAKGDTLLHSDLRSDNIVLRPNGQVQFVDWAHAARGAAWIDPLIFALCSAAQGFPDPGRLFAAHAEGRAALPDRVDSVLAALAGRFIVAMRRPGPPAVRAFQNEEARAALNWLVERDTRSGH